MIAKQLLNLDFELFNIFEKQGEPMTDEAKVRFFLALPRAVLWGGGDGLTGFGEKKSPHLTRGALPP